MAQVRAAESNDASDIRAIHVAAFPTTAEADLVERLEAGGDAAISLVAEAEGRVVGHVLLSRMRVEAADGPVRALALAPVAVLPERQRRGIGGLLVRAALDGARAEGEAMAFVLGDPAYYARFGFSAEAAARFSSPYAGPHLMAARLGDAPTGAGKADYPPAFAAFE